MADIHDVINNLSNDELDLLNSDPKMLADFKAKYSGGSSTTTSQPSTDSDVLKETVQNLPGLTGHFAREVMNTPQDILNNVKGIGALGAGAIYGAVNPTGALTDLVKQGPTLIGDTAKSIGNALTNPVKTVEENPVSTAIGIASLKTPIDVSGESLRKAAVSKLPKIFRVLGNVPEQATETLLKSGGNLPKYTPEAAQAVMEDVQKALGKVAAQGEPTEASQAVKAAVTDNVQSALENLVKERGATLNKAKAEVGLPVTPDEKVQSLKKVGNEFGLSHADLLKTKEGEPFAAHAYDWAEQGQKYYKLMGDPEQVMKATNGAHPTGSDVPEEVVKKLGIPVKESPILQDFKNPKDLAIAIDDFKQQAPSMSDAQRVKAASHLQDKINQLVDWNKTGSSTEGILKTQYKDLQDLAIPDSLKDSKAGMKQALDLMHDLESKIGDDPGKAQDFLQRLFTSKKASSQDYIKRLATLQEQTGHPILSRMVEAFVPKPGNPEAKALSEKMGGLLGKDTGAIEQKLQQAFLTDNPIGNDIKANLSKLEDLSGTELRGKLDRYFASKSFSKLAARPGLQIAEAMHGALSGSPKALIKTALSLGIQSPLALKVLVKGILNTPITGPLRAGIAAGTIAGEQATRNLALGDALNEESRRALQSVKDRLKNRNAK